MPFRECLTKCGACCVARQLFVLCSQIFLFSAIVPVALCELVIQAFHIKLYTEPEQKHVIVITGASSGQFYFLSIPNSIYELTREI
ncbi:hypothetical protein BKA69DRAFT_1047874 [Paraphysoderma sedebokerense]|nr:hypothetical protein BKA69DRAFT_1047874 [Paraphysoderma sedebokerense]